MSESWDGGKWLGVCVGLAGDLGRDFGGWPCPRRVCLGRECSPVLTGGDVGGQSLAAHPAPSGARDAVLPSPFFFSSPPWFSWLPNEHSDSCLLEERRSSLGIV